MSRLALLIGTAAAVNLRSNIPVHVATGVLGEQQSAENMFDALTDLLANEDGNTPALATFVNSIRQMLDSSMKPKIMENRATQQGLVQRSFDAFASCASAAASREADITAKRTAFQGQAAAHRQCRGIEATLADDSKACAAQQATAQQLQTAACQDFNSFANGGAATCSRNGGESYRDYSSRLQAFFQGQVTLFDQKDKACKDATASLQALAVSCRSKANATATQKDRCNQIQDQMDGTSCGIGSDGQAACSAVDACYQQSLNNFNAVVAAARIQEVGLKTEWEAVLRLECLTGVFALADGERGNGIQACRSADYAREVAALSLTYPAAPAKPSCSLPTGLAGSADYAAAQYSPLPASAPAKSCTASCCQVATTAAPTTTTTTTTTTTRGTVVTCVFTVDNAVDSVRYNGQDIMSSVSGDVNSWPARKTFSFNFVNGAVLTIGGWDAEQGSCASSGFAIQCDGPAAGVSDPANWQYWGSNSPIPAGDIHRTGAGDGWGPVQQGTSAFYLDGVPNIRKMWGCANGNTKYITFRYPAGPVSVQGPPVTCSFTVDNAVDSVRYNGQDILSSVAGDINSWPAVKTFSVRYAKGAVLAISGWDAEDGSCQSSGFAIVCNGLAAGVNDMANWQYWGSNSPIPAGDVHRTGDGAGWLPVSSSTSAFSLAVSAPFNKMWGCRNGNSKYISFKYTM